MSRIEDFNLINSNPYGQLGDGKDATKDTIAVAADALPVRITEDGILYSDGSVLSIRDANDTGDEILMSRKNPNGYPLEELLAKLVVEIEGKTDHIRSNKNLAHVVNNNNRVITKLQEAIDIWNESREGLTKCFGEDKGPNNPRV